MDGEFLKADTKFPPEKLCGARHEHEYDDRISELPDEIKVMILSSLPLREAAAASVLSSRWSGLWKHTPDLKFDRISKLPDQIIAGILSFLPLREAASTSVLSSRWSDLWKHTPNLNFEFDTGRALRSWDAHKCKYVELVNSVLQSHKAPSLKQFSISFYLDKSAQLYVNKWLEFVFSRQVESLALNFRIFEEKYLAVLEVEEMLKESRVTSMTDVILSKSLKRLSLQFLKVSGEAMELILRSCPLLEELVIGFVFLTSDVELCGASLMLKHLEISGCRGGKSIKISAPNLEWLSVDELSGKLLLENVPKHVRADFDIIFGWQDDLQSFASAVFFCISSQLTILNLTLYAPEMFLAYGLVKMPNLKKLVVGYYGRIPPSLLPLTALIWASPRLEEFKLEIKITRKDSDLYKVVKSNVERSPHQHLKVFELAQFFRGNGDNVKELVTYIVNNCIALQKIIFGGRSWFHYCDQFRDFEDDEQARDYAKQQLQDKLPQHIQMQLL